MIHLEYHRVPIIFLHMHLPQKDLKELIKIIEQTLYVVFEISEKLDELRWKRTYRKYLKNEN